MKKQLTLLCLTAVATAMVSSGLSAATEPTPTLVSSAPATWAGDAKEQVRTFLNAKRAFEAATHKSDQAKSLYDAMTKNAETLKASAASAANKRMMYEKHVYSKAFTLLKEFRAAAAAPAPASVAPGAADEGREYLWLKSEVDAALLKVRRLKEHARQKKSPLVPFLDSIIQRAQPLKDRAFAVTHSGDYRSAMGLLREAQAILSERPGR